MKTLTAIAALALTTMLSVGAASAAPLQFEQLLLLNGWKPYDSTLRGPRVAIDSDGIVHLRGGIKLPTGSNNIPFRLPAAYRPGKLVYVVTNLYGGAPGRLVVYPNGEVVAQAAGSQSNAYSFTSLEGVNFAK